MSSNSSCTSVKSALDHSLPVSTDLSCNKSHAGGQDYGHYLDGDGYLTRVTLSGGKVALLPALLCSALLCSALLCSPLMITSFFFLTKIARLFDSYVRHYLSNNFTLIHLSLPSPPLHFIPIHSIPLLKAHFLGKAVRTEEFAAEEKDEKVLFRR